jgi:hypothetical protein
VATYYHYADVVRQLLEHGANGNAEWAAVGALKVAIGRGYCDNALLLFDMEEEDGRH